MPGKAFLESVVYKVRLVSLSGALIETARRPEGEGSSEAKERLNGFVAWLAALQA